MPQKRFGWYFSMSGVSLANSARLLKHVLWNSLVACTMCASPLPYVCFASASFFFASLHLSSNHGASVFPHLFGFLGRAIFSYFTTPAVKASCIIKSSTSCALLSLDLLGSYIIFPNFSRNAGS
jgi:hypothetical protein